MAARTSAAQKRAADRTATRFFLILLTATIVLLGFLVRPLEAESSCRGKQPG